MEPRRIVQRRDLRVAVAVVHLDLRSRDQAVCEIPVEHGHRAGWLQLAMDGNRVLEVIVGCPEAVNLVTECDRWMRCAPRLIHRYACGVNDVLQLPFRLPLLT